MCNSCALRCYMGSWSWQGGKLLSTAAAAAFDRCRRQLAAVQGMRGGLAIARLVGDWQAAHSVTANVH
jgi:hypothetical protein